MPAPKALPDLAILPLGAMEQHGPHLPLLTDTMIAASLAGRLAKETGGFLLPPLPFGCSQEHQGFTGTLSLRVATLLAVIQDLATDLARQGVRRLAIVNGHGGHAILDHLAKETTQGSSLQIIPLPLRAQWEAAVKASGLPVTVSEDMHAGAIETSILLALSPETVSELPQDHLAPDRRYLNLLGLKAYAPEGYVGRPRAANKEAGEKMLQVLTAEMQETLKALGE